MADWVFLTKHALVLSFIAQHPHITAQEIATAIGTTERQVRRIIADLYAEEYIDKQRNGRGIKYRINTGKMLRHNTHREVHIGDFLKALGWQG
jgi:predicted transcriptional regulator